MNAELNETRREVLKALCDTFVPSLKVSDDPIGFWGRAASDLGVDCVLARSLKEDVPPELYAGLVGLLDALGAKGLVKASQGRREGLLAEVARSSPQAQRGVDFFQKQTVLLAYGLPERPPGDQSMVTYGSPRGQNPNWEVLNYPGPVSVPPDKPKQIQTWTPEGDSQTIEADVCIVGSGAGGAVIASKLSAQGLRVVVLEAGGHYNAADFHQLELWGYKHLWYRGGATPTADGNVLLLAGGSLGGGTEINWMNCVRTPPLVREDWVRQFGLDGVNSSQFDRYQDDVESRIQANQRTALWNSQNLRMREGCQKLGYLSKQTFVNWDPKLFQPLMAGYTGFGDQTGGKQTARRTFLLDAYRDGARIIVHCRADRVIVSQGRASGVEATYSDPKGRRTKLTILAPQVVAAAGSLETPALLLRSGIGGPNVGKFLRVQPGGAVYGVYEEKQKGWWGSPMTTNCEQFVDTGGGHGFYMEIPAFGPGFVASVIPWVSGRQHKEMMTKVPYISTFIWFLRDKGYGRITIDKAGNSVATYELSDETDQKNFRHAASEAIRIHEAAGAREIMVSLSHGQLIWRRGQNLESFIKNVARQPVINGAQPMISAHQLSTCRMGKDPSDSVADTNGELRDVRGVWIGDGSACPTALGANPMVTIMALAERTADRMAAAASRAGDGASRSSQRSDARAYQGTQPGASRREPAGVGAAAGANLIELNTKPGQAERVLQIISSQVLPNIIRPAEGFVDLLVLHSPDDPNRLTSFSFWENPDYAERFQSGGFLQSTELIKDLLAEPPSRSPYVVGFSTNPRIRGWGDAPDSNRGQRRDGPDGRGAGAITDAAGNMMRGMTELMNPATMFREMTGIMTNPLNMFSLAQRVMSGSVQQAGEAGDRDARGARASAGRRAGGGAPVLQTVNIIDLDARPGEARRVVEIIGGQAIPTVIRPFEGFIDEIVLVSLSDPNHVTAISFWEDEESPQRFNQYGFSRVSALLRDVLAAPPRRRHYNVSASTNPYILGWSS
jgi:choline dehydrogenase-like flavoprotein/quinol monooxygenase YgiN